jgi:hypothetical protein
MARTKTEDLSAEKELDEEETKKVKGGASKTLSSSLSTKDTTLGGTFTKTSSSSPQLL